MEPWEFVRKYVTHIENEYKDEEFKMACMVGALHASLSSVFSTLRILHPDALETILSNGTIGQFYKSLNTQVKI